MARKKRSRKTARSSPRKLNAGSSAGHKSDIAWRNLVLFLVLFVFSFLLYSFATNDLLRNFFGIVSIILGFLTFAFLIVFVVLIILKSGKKSR